MNALRVLFAGLLLIVVAFPAVAWGGEEEKGGEKKGTAVRGIVVDAKSRSPLVYANIGLRVRGRDELVTSTFSGENGEFVLDGLAPGTYTLTVTYVGYDRREVMEVQVDGRTRLDLGTLTLEESAVAVNEVTVEAERAPETFQLDKKVINVSQSLHAKGGTALDALRDQPSVRVDESDNVTLRGSATFTVLINGRPGPFQGADALRSIPANQVERIELITNPSARHEAQGSAGIVNIVLKREERGSTSAILNLGSGTKDKYNADATVTTTIGATTLSGGGEWRKNTYFQDQDVDRLTFSPSGPIANVTDMYRRDIREQFSGRLGLEHRFDDQHVLSLNGTGGRNMIPRYLTQNMSNVSPTEALYRRIVNTREITADYVSGNAAWVWTPGEKQELSVEASATSISVPWDQTTKEYVSDPSFLSRGPEPNTVHLTTDVDRTEGRSKITWTAGDPEQGRFECGLQYDIASRSIGMKNEWYDWTLKSWTPDPILSNDFTLRNQVQGSFVQYATTLGGTQIQVGLRAEYMDRLLTQKTMGSSFAYSRWDLFPSINASRSFGAHQVQVGFSRRINRPDETLLNPFPFYSDSWLTSRGNPRLLPEYINALEVNYQTMLSGLFVSVQNYLRQEEDAIWQSLEADSLGRVLSTFGNFAKDRSIGSEISLSYQVLPWLRLDPNVNLFQYSIQGNAVGRSIDQSSFTWTGRLTAVLTLGPDTRLQITGMYLSRQINPQTDTDPLFFLSVSARQDFFGRSLSLTLQAQNLTNTVDYKILSRGANFENHFLVRPEMPVVNLNLSWNFNNFRRPARTADGVDVGVAG